MPNYTDFFNMSGQGMGIDPASSNNPMQPAMNPFVAKSPTVPSSNRYLTGQQEAAYNTQMMGDPQFAMMVRAAEYTRKKKTLQDMMTRRKSSMEALGKSLPKLKEMQEQMKIQDAERKLKKLKLDYLTKQAEAFAPQQAQ